MFSRLLNTVPVILTGFSNAINRDKHPLSFGNIFDRAYSYIDSKRSIAT
jgi:hypothetical protein